MSFDIKVLGASITSLPEEYLIMYNYLNEEEKERLESYYFLKDKLLFLLGRYLLKKGIQTIFGLDFADSALKFNKYGKPFLRDNKKINFSISHSKEMVLVAFAQYPIGIDIEYKGQHPDENLINDLFFTSCEISYLKSLSKKYRKDMFYKMWTLKEAYVKTIGLGMSAKPNKINVMQKNILRYNRNKYKVKSLNLLPTYSCSISYDVRLSDSINFLSFN